MRTTKTVTASMKVATMRMMAALWSFWVLVASASETFPNVKGGEAQGLEFQNDPSSSSSIQQQQQRRLVLKDGDTVNGKEVEYSRGYQDSFTNPLLLVNVTTRFSGDESVDVQFQLACNSTSSTIPFRQLADTCTCRAQKIGNGGDDANPQMCSCAVCAENMGANNISVDCSRSGANGFGGVVVDTCSAVDCNYGCVVVEQVPEDDATAPTPSGGGGVQGDPNNPPSPTEPSPPSAAVAPANLSKPIVLFWAIFLLAASLR